MNKENNRKYAICKLKIIGETDDNLISVETGCTDGNGKKDIAVINTDDVLEIIQYPKVKLNEK